MKSAAAEGEQLVMSFDYYETTTVTDDTPASATPPIKLIEEIRLKSTLIFKDVKVSEDCRRYILGCLRDELSRRKELTWETIDNIVWAKASLWHFIRHGISG